MTSMRNINTNKISGHRLEKHQARWLPGYRLPSAMRASLARLSKPSPIIMVGSAIGYLCSIAVVAIGLSWAWENLPIFQFIAIATISSLLVARQMRGMECLVHEGSHCNLYRGNKFANDILTNLLAAWPMALDVRTYRLSHNIHHVHFGSAQDPDLQRYQALALDELDRFKLHRFALGLFVRLPHYWRGWFAAIGISGRQIMFAATWHVIAVLLLSALQGPALALGLWGISWLLPMAIVLPIIRLIGEAGEHRYPKSALGITNDANDVRNVFDSTISNIGWTHRSLFHPFGDGFHNLHHLFPGVPGYRLGILHRLLVMHDANGCYDSRLPRRYAVLAEPESYAYQSHLESRHPTPPGKYPMRTRARRTGSLA